MAIFNSYVSHYQRVLVNPLIDHHDLAITLPISTYPHMSHIRKFHLLSHLRVSVQSDDLHPGSVTRLFFKVGEEGIITQL